MTIICIVDAVPNKGYAYSIFTVSSLETLTVETEPIHYKVQVRQDQSDRNLLELEAVESILDLGCIKACSNIILYVTDATTRSILIDPNIYAGGSKDITRIREKLRLFNIIIMVLPIVCANVIAYPELYWTHKLNSDINELP